MRSFPLALVFAVALAGGALAISDQESTVMPTLAELQKMTARFAPADIGADISALPKNERQALARLVDAARIMDALFLRQVWAGNDAVLQELARLAAAPARPPARPPAARRGAGRPARVTLGGRAAALLPDQQRTVGPPESLRAVRPGRAGQAGR